MSDGEHEKRPTLALAVLALLGLYAIPRAIDPAQSAGEQASVSQGAAARLATVGSDPLEDPAEEKVEILRPLLEHYAPDGRVTARKAEDALRQIQESVNHAGAGLRSLVVLLPDPMNSSVGYRFDDYIDVVQRAVEAQGYVLERYRMPWTPRAAGAPTPGDRLGRVLVRAPLLGARAAWTSAAPETRVQPGLVVFRRVNEVRPSSGKGGVIPRSLAVFIVAESPTWGLDREALHKCLTLIESIEPRDADPQGCLTCRIVGPCFSGTQSSLQEALGGWLESRGKDARKIRCEVISGGSSMIDKAQFEAYPRRHAKGAGAQTPVFRFRSMVHTGNAVRQVLLDYLGEPGKVALLVESNTGFGRSMIKEARIGQCVEYPFPMNVREIRKSYESKGLFRSAEERLPPAEHLAMRSDDANPPRDTVAAFHPAAAAAIDELSLAQILTDISRRRMRAVGIFATDPLDVIFLARMIRRFCPDVRIFTTQADLLFTRSENVSELRGMLVASTYPLYPHNQTLSYPFSGDRSHLSFSSHGAQGLYNAAVAQLSEAGVTAASAWSPDTPPPLLEYGRPYGVAPASRVPPIWLSMVGHRGLYPVRVVHRAPAHLAPGVPKVDPAYSPDELKYMYNLNVDAPTVGGPRIGRAGNPFEPAYHNFWLGLFTLLSIACFGTAGVTLFYYRWLGDKSRRDSFHIGLLNLDFKPLRILLNCSTDGEAESVHPCRGPGLYLLALQVVLLTTYGSVVIPMLLALSSKELSPEPFRLALLLLGLATLWILLTSILISCVCVLRDREGMRRWNWARELRVALDRRLGRKYRVLRLATLSLLMVVVPVVTRRWSAGNNIEYLLSFERSMILPSGVSPVFPSLFLAAAAAAWIFAQLKRRSVLHWFMLKAPSVTLPESPTVLEVILGEFRKQREELDNVLERPLEILRDMNPILMVVGALLLLLYAGPIIWRRPWTPEGTWFDLSFWSLYLLVYCSILTGSLRLLTFWFMIKDVLRQVIQLPFARSLDRLPRRLSQWFFKASTPEERKRLIMLQADSLAYASDERAWQGLQMACPHLDRAAWDTMTSALGDKRSAVRHGVNSTRTIIPLLLRIWETEPGHLFANAPRGRAGVSRTQSRTDPERQHEGATDRMPHPAASGEEKAKVREWVTMAEDLLAFQVVRWLAPSLFQVWTQIKYLVVASLMLIFAVNSYPFPQQGHVLGGLAILIACVAVLVGYVVIEISHEEFISRVTKTSSGGFLLNSKMIGPMLTYVLPLLGVLAALSLDATDVVRSWFGPLARLIN